MSLVYKVKKHKKNQQKQLNDIGKKICRDKFKKGFFIGAVFGAVVTLILTDDDK